MLSLLGKVVITSLETLVQSCLRQKNEELAEETDRKRRAANLIIHGKDEEAPPNDDNKFINDLITNLQIGVINIKQTGRIGISNEGRARPIKLVFNNEDDKQKVYNNLKNPKGNASYKGISIKEDYTFNERLLIKEFADQAKENSSKLQYHLEGQRPDPKEAHKDNTRHHPPRSQTQ